MINVAIIGYGYWGPKLVRNFINNINFNLVGVVDYAESARERCLTENPDVAVFSEIDEISKLSEIDLIALATPASTHYEIGVKVLKSGKHLFVEKPYTLDSQSAVELNKIALQNKLKIFVDHTFLFSQQIRYIKRMISSNELGEIILINSQRVNLGIIQKDTSVEWDLATHDIAILNYLLESTPSEVKVINSINQPSVHPSTSLISMRYPKNILAQVTTSWMSPVKLRQIAIIGSKRSVIFDDTNVIEKVKVYDSAIELRGSQSGKTITETFDYRIGDIFTPVITEVESLKTEFEEVASTLIHGTQFPSSGEFALEVIKVLERIEAESSTKAGSR